MSPAQERKLRRETEHPNVHRRVVTLPWLLRGQLEIDALDRAVAALVDRHAVLRSAFRPAPPQYHMVPTDFVPHLVVEDAATLDHTELRNRLLDLSHFQPDLWSGPLAEFRLLRLRPDRHILVVNVDHNIFDGESSRVVLTELLRDYELERAGSPADHDQPQITFAHFAAWQHCIVESRVGTDLRRFWGSYLAGSSGSVDLSGREQGASGYSGRSAGDSMAPETTTAIQHAIRSHRVTPFVYWLACLAAFASADSGNDVTVFGSVANRRRPEFTNVIGHLSNTVVFRPEVRLGVSFTDLLHTTRTHALTVLAHADFPFAEIVRTVWPERYEKPPVLPGLYLDVRHVPAGRSDAPLHSLDVVPIDLPSDRSDPGFNVWVAAGHDRMALKLLHDRGLPDDVADGHFRRLCRLAANGAVSPDDPVGVLLDRKD